MVLSYDGFSSYLLIVDEATRYVWVFLTHKKEPLMDIIDTFLHHFGHTHGGSIRTDLGGELARSFALSDMVLRSHKYVKEPTGADSPSQNGSVEVYNNKRYGLALSYTVLVCRPNIGQPRSYTRFICTTAWSTLLQEKLHLRACLALNRILDISNCSDLMCALNKQESAGRNWIAMISKVYFCLHSYGPECYLLRSGERYQKKNTSCSI